MGLMSIFFPLYHRSIILANCTGNNKPIVGDPIALPKKNTIKNSLPILPEFIKIATT
jgi:hypothetical protein